MVLKVVSSGPLQEGLGGKGRAQESSSSVYSAPWVIENKAAGSKAF